MSADQINKILNVPRGVPTARYYPPQTVEVPQNSEVPLFGKDDKPENQLQQVLNANVRVFNLSIEQDLKDYTAVWQLITFGKGAVSESVVNFHNGTYVALLRWSEFSLKIPDTKKL